MKTGLLAAAFLVLLAIPAISLPAHASPSGKYFDNIVTILMENQDLCSIYVGCGGSAVYQSTLADTNTLVNTWGTINHASEPNYIALAGAINDGATSGDGRCCYFEPGNSILQLMNNAGVSWTAYAESASGSGTCNFNPPRHGDHFGFIDFAANNNPSICSHFISDTSGSDTKMIADLNSAAPSQFIWMTPTDNNNGHDNGILGGDRYLAALVPQILTSTTFLTQRATLLILYDEGYSQCNNTGGTGECVYASFSGPAASKLLKISPNGASHYSYAKTLEENWGMPSLNSNDANAPSMAAAFGPVIPPCSNGATNPPTCDIFPAPPPPQGGFGSCASLPTGWNCGNNKGLAGTQATITNGNLLTDIFASNTGGNTNYQYSTSQKGTFPWSPCRAPALGVLPVNLTDVSTTFTPSILPSTGRYHINIAFYYWLPNGPVTVAGVTHQCLDTQSRVENINGVFSSVGTTATYNPGDSFGWDQVTLGSVSINEPSVLTANVASQCSNALLAWGMLLDTPCQLAGIEIGTEGYQFQQLSVAFSNVTFITGSPPPPNSLIGDLNSGCSVGLDDLSILLFNMGHPGPLGDENADLLVNLEDLSILLFNYGRTC